MDECNVIEQLEEIKCHCLEALEQSTHLASLVGCYFDWSSNSHHKAPHLIDVAKRFSCLRWSFAIPNVHKLSTMMDIVLSRHLWYFIFLLWNQRQKVKLPQIRPQCLEVYGSQPHLQFELPKIEGSIIKLVNGSNIVALE